MLLLGQHVHSSARLSCGHRVPFVALEYSPATQGPRRRRTRLLVTRQCVRRDGKPREGVALRESASAHLQGAGGSNGSGHRADERRRPAEDPWPGKEPTGEQQGESQHTAEGRHERDVKRSGGHTLQIQTQAAKYGQPGSHQGLYEL